MVVIYRTEHVFKNIVLFWVLCALDVNCIQPVKETRCDFRKLWYTHLYAGKIKRNLTVVNKGDPYTYSREKQIDKEK